MNPSDDLTFSQSSISISDGLFIAVFASSIIHALIFLGINFTAPPIQKTTKQIEITIANSPAKKAPKKSTYLAQENQIGAGEKVKKQKPPKQKLPSRGNHQNKPAKPKRIQSASQPKAIKKLITQKQAEQKISSTLKHENTSAPPRPKLSSATIQQQIAQLGAKIRYSQQSSDQTDIKFVNSVSTHKYIAAQYVIDWEHKVESVGNLNYPEAARTKGISSTLTTDVGINADGTIYSIRITKSSGNKALDDAAKRIILLSAPFAALPKELLKELKVLVITRVWKFTDESGNTTP